MGIRAAIVGYTCLLYSLVFRIKGWTRTTAPWYCPSRIHLVELPNGSAHLRNCLENEPGKSEAM